MPEESSKLNDHISLHRVRFEPNVLVIQDRHYANYYGFFNY